MERDREGKGNPFTLPNMSWMVKWRCMQVMQANENVKGAGLKDIVPGPTVCYISYNLS